MCIKPKPYRQAVMAIFLDVNNQFLIGSSPRDGGFKFPQGGLDENETHLNGIIREVFEELGTEIRPDDIILKLNKTVKYPYHSDKPYSKKYSGQEMIVFAVKVNEKMSFIPQDNEFDELHWITIEQLDLYDFQHRKVAYHEALHMVFEQLKE